MTMSEGEIVRDFRTAKKKREQISILAELNQCSRDKIREILLRNGISEAELPSKQGRRRAEETEVFSQQIKKNHAKTEEFRSGKLEPEEPAGTKTTEEILQMEETAEPESVHVVAPEVRHEVPESVKTVCRDRIWGIAQEIGVLERERMELQKFLEEAEGVN